MVALLKTEKRDVIEELLGFAPKRLRHNIGCDVVMVTPELAKILLGRNLENNRRVAARRVSRYAQQMKLGEWKLSDPLKFNENGDPFDGQHRLHAVIEADMSVPFVVLYGYPTESMSCVDLGASRRVSDVAKIEGIDLSPDKASIVLAMVGDYGSNTSNTDLTVQQRIDTYQAHKEAIDFAAQYFGKTAVRHAHVRAAIAKAYYHEDEARLLEFMKVLDTGFPVSGSEEDNAAIAMRNTYLMSKKIMSSHVGRKGIHRKTVYAIKKFCRRKDVKTIRESAKDLYPLED
jgi:hypothetical protein